MAILNYILLHLRLVLFSGSGFFVIFLLLYLVGGFKYSFLPTITALFTIWVLRYFVMTLYISYYLGSLYQGERWYFWLFQAANIFNSLFGVLTLKILIEGKVAKNILIVGMVEMSFTVFMFVPMLILNGLLGNGYSLTEQGFLNPIDIYIPIVTVFIVFWILRFGEPVIERYREWEPKHPVLLNIMITIYLLVGFLSNYRVVITRGNVGFAIILVLALIILIYFWYDYLHMLRMQEMARKEELISLEKSMKKHYADVLEQTAKLENYRHEISAAIDRIIKKIEAEDPRAVRGDKMEGDFQSVATRYLEEVRQQYDELTVQKYCEDIRMNDFLLTCEDYLKGKGVEAIFLFREYRTPSDISFADIEAVIRWMLEGTAGLMESKGRSLSVKEQTKVDRIILHGGMTGKELVLSCEAEGNCMKRPDQRKIRKLLKRINADLDIIKDKERIQILVGIPSVD